jgi:hypothetical protein
MKLQLYPEECCEDCQDIIHNHIDCPQCGTNYASTDIYGSLYELPEEEQVITCEECGARYKLISGKPYTSTADWLKL